MSRAAWYWRRLGQMSTRELAWRVGEQVRRRVWTRRQVRPGDSCRLDVGARPAPLATRLPPEAAADVPAAARRCLITVADDLLAGHWEVFGVRRHDLQAPDWFTDPVTGRRAPQERNAFRVKHRSEDLTGNVMHLWELSRHYHLTVLAAAWLLTGDDRYAEAVDGQLRSWWQENPFLSGVHWTSGIELGMRLIAWTWVRRLLDGWPGVGELFDGNEDALRQLYWHQQYLAAFGSRGSSANNHVIAEAAGQLTASCAFPWFPESEYWRASSSAVLERELASNTFPSGVNRELGSDYHCFVAELGLIAAVEAEAAGHPLGDTTWMLLCAMVDAAAALVDERLAPPRQGDGDDGRGLLLDDPGTPIGAVHWESLLALGAGLFGPREWWPGPTAPDVRSTLLAALAGPDQPGLKVTERPSRRPSHFADAGITLLRAPPPQSARRQSARPEIWCRCDAGPHGYLSIAAHAHADALSVEVRHGGVEVLADPGTYCYHGEAEWRSYFRSTLAHNTLELDEQDQSQAAGAFLWVRAAATQQLQVAVGTGGIESWSAEHDGYGRLDPPATHRRTVRLDPGRRRLEIADQVVSKGNHRWRLAFHLGPDVAAVLDRGLAHLSWTGAGGPASAIIHLPDELKWRLHRGETDPILGWYSSGLGCKTPTVSLIGIGTLGAGGGGIVTTADVVTIVDFRP